MSVLALVIKSLGVGLKIYGVVGAGGHGRESIPLVRHALASQIDASVAALYFVVEGCVSETSVNGYKIITVEQFCALDGEKVFNTAIGNSAVRERIAEYLIVRGCAPFPIIAANAVIMDGNEIGEGALLSPFTMITSNVRIGKYFHANMYSYVAHDCVIGNFVTLAPGVKCNGNVVIGDHAYIGAGAVLRQGTAERPLIIGRGAVVGMGAVVTKNVAPHATVVGNPARPMGARR